MCKKILYIIISIFISQIGHAEENPGHSSGFRFIENKNQWESKIEFKAEIPSGTLFLEKNCFTYHLVDEKLMNRHSHKNNLDTNSLINGHAFKVNFRNSNPDAVLNGEDEQADYNNYFIGKDPSKWASHVKAYGAIQYHNLYDGIDLKIYSLNNHLKYDFTVLPNVNPAFIQIQYEGLTNIYIKEGNLVLQTSVGNIIENKPFAYQLINGKTISIPCNYVLGEEGQNLSFSLPAGYNKNYALVIDPVLIFSTYSGSTADNFGYSATPDSEGFLYSGSTVFDIGYPIIIGAYQANFAGAFVDTVPFSATQAYLIGGSDIGITKYDTSGTKRIYSTYLGGSNNEIPHSLIVNSNDELFIFGTTGSSDFPVTLTAYDTSFSKGTRVDMRGINISYYYGCDIIVSKLSIDGSQLLASTYLGGTANDGLLYKTGTPSNLRYNYADEVRGEIEIDKSDNIYIASCTRSGDFPIVGSTFQTTPRGGNFEAVVVKMDNNLQSIIWSSFLGGNRDDAAYAIELDSASNIYIVGGTTSTDFPKTSGSLYVTNQGGLADGFITHVDKNGASIIHSTYYGSPTYDQIYLLGLDKQNNVHVFGQTMATGVNGVRYIKNAGFSQPNSGQFISKINPSLDTLIWSTTFGNGSGKPNISPTAFLVDLCSKIYLSGWGGTPASDAFLNDSSFIFNMLTTLGPNPTSDYYQSSTDGHDFYLFVMEGDASTINYASFFGGNQSREHVDGGTSRFDRSGKIYQAMCAGCGGHSDMPLKPALGAAELPSTNNSDNCNIGVFKMDFRLPQVIADFKANPACAGDSIHFINKSYYKTTTKFTWYFGDGDSSNLKNPSHAYKTGGTYNIKLVLFDNATCNLTDAATKSLYISSINNLSIQATADQYTIYKGKSTILHATPNSGYGYRWTPSATLSDSSSPNPVATPPVTTKYTVTFADPLVSKCRVVDTVTINVIEIICEEPYIYIPNAFTPDGDDKNDVLFVRSNNIRDLYLAIYNRWGEKVFDTKDQNIGWDGTYKGMKADPGVFDYYVEATCVDDQKFFKKGNITLIR